MENPKHLETGKNSENVHQASNGVSKLQNKSKQQASPVVNWCFTLNNYTEKDIEELNMSHENIRFMLVGAEVGELGTPHLQGYIQLVKKARMEPIKKYFKCFNRVHLEPCRGTVEQNIKYVSKENKIVVNVGAPSIERTLDCFRQQINKCQTWSEVLDIPQTSKHLQYARECWANRKPTPMENVALRGWQKTLYDELMKPADDRTIIWVYDPKGGKGKTFFAKYMMSNYNAFYCSPARQADILCLYDNQKIVLYDIPRCVDEEYINYGVLEKIKDGIVFSGKYSPITKVRKENAHVVVFSNHECEEGKFSEDRIKKIDLTNESTDIVTQIIESAVATQLVTNRQNASTKVGSPPSTPVESPPIGGDLHSSAIGDRPPMEQGGDLRGVIANNSPSDDRFILKFYSPIDDEEKSLCAAQDPENLAVSDSITRNCGSMELLEV